MASLADDHFLYSRDLNVLFKGKSHSYGLKGQMSDGTVWASRKV